MELVKNLTVKQYIFKAHFIFSLSRSSARSLQSGVSPLPLTPTVPRILWGLIGVHFVIVLASLFTGIKQYYTIVPSHPLPHRVFEAKTAAVIQLLSSVSFHQCLIFSNMQTRSVRVTRLQIVFSEKHQIMSK